MSNIDKSWFSLIFVLLILLSGNFINTRRIKNHRHTTNLKSLFDIALKDINLIKEKPIIKNSVYSNHLTNKFIVNTLKELNTLSNNKNNFKEIGSFLMGMFMLTHRSNIPIIKTLSFDMGKKNGKRWIDTVGKNPEEKIGVLSGKKLLDWIITYLYMSYFNKDESQYLSNLRTLLQKQVLNPESVKKMKKYMFKYDISKFQGLNKQGKELFNLIWSFAHAYVILASGFKSKIGEGFIKKLLELYTSKYRPLLSEFYATKNQDRFFSNEEFYEVYHNLTYWITHIVFTLVNFTGNVIKNAEQYFLPEIKFLEDGIPSVIKKKDTDMLGEMIDTLTILNSKNDVVKTAIDALIKRKLDIGDFRMKSGGKINSAIDWYHTPIVVISAFSLKRKHDNVAYPEFLHLFENANNDN